jgi:phosphatidate cytidylyltransferase
VLAAALVGGYELSNMARVSGFGRSRQVIPALSLAAAGVAGALGGREVTIIGFWAASLITGATLAEITSRPGRDKRLSITIAVAAVYFGGALAHVAPLSAFEQGREWVLLAVLGTFAIDTGAFFTGLTVGRHKLAPSISPRKTWEGVFGGAAAAVAAVFGLVAVLDLPLAAWQSVALGLAMTAGGVAGDLFESWLKRRAGVKDSGAIIPGHGGILDRIDSLAPNFAVVYWAALWTGV